MTKIIEISTKSEFELVNITDQIEKIVREAKVSDGVAVVFTKHTTGAVIINENEAGLLEDIENLLKKLVPKGVGYKHDRIDVNAHSHLKGILLGSSQNIPIAHGELQLGTWQRVFFVELDGPRQRNVLITVIGK
ncbi:MAG: secondary thiamine-phosphate synthase enzyme YjbQ [Euryarchaeota archaeon]|nr:secondary thiamine-phosphate synthase enzyme YjbQ [Euryarchaeota archaeon]